MAMIYATRDDWAKVVLALESEQIKSKAMWVHDPYSRERYVKRIVDALQGRADTAIVGVGLPSEFSRVMYTGMQRVDGTVRSYGRASDALGVVFYGGAEGFRWDDRWHRQPDTLERMTVFDNQVRRWQRDAANAIGPIVETLWPGEAQATRKEIKSGGHASYDEYEVVVMETTLRRLINSSVLTSDGQTRMLAEALAHALHFAGLIQRFTSEALATTKAMGL